MHWKTQMTIHEVQNAITWLREREGRTTREAVGLTAGITGAYVTKLLKRYPEYLGDVGDGTITIVQPIDKPAKPQEPVIKLGSTAPSDVALNSLHIISQTTGQYEAVLTRIAEALENSRQPAPVEKPTRETKPTAERFGLSNPQHSAILKRTNWDAVEAKREELLGNATALELYVIWLNIGRHLRKNSATLVQMVESSLERVNNRSQ